MTDIKRLGCCTLCDEPVFEVIAAHTEGPYDGHPRELGPAMEKRTMLSFNLKSGRRIVLTFCSECADGLGRDKFDEIWQKCIASNQYEIDATAIKLTPKQTQAHEQGMAQMRADSIERMTNAKR
ncbi:MAG: hypothetical protein GY906_24330 [bacterium]|nr:hypothetical protein [bacterium]